MEALSSGVNSPKTLRSNRTRSRLQVNLTTGNAQEERRVTKSPQELQIGSKQTCKRKVMNSNRNFQEKCKKIMSTSSSRFANFKPAQKVPYLYMQFFTKNHLNAGSQQDCYPLSPTNGPLQELNLSEYQSIQDSI